MNVPVWPEDPELPDPDPTIGPGVDHPSEPRRVKPLVPHGTAHRARPTLSNSPTRVRPALPVDDRQWSRAIDRRVKLWHHSDPTDADTPVAGQPAGEPAPPGIPAAHLAAASRASFCLDGIEVSERDVRTAIDTGSAARTLGSRHVQRVRAHIAIFRRIERLARRQLALLPGEVFRWHAALACGLPTAVPDAALTVRLTDVCFRLATPHRRRIPAVEEASRIYAGLLRDPLFPNFNGILARLMLSYALARTGLPPVVFDAERDADPDAATPRRLQELIAGALDALIAT